MQSVRFIYAYYKHYGYQTEVMGASFRNVGEILAQPVRPADHLARSAQSIAGMSEPVERKLVPGHAAVVPDRLTPANRHFAMR